MNREDKTAQKLFVDGYDKKELFSDLDVKVPGLANLLGVDSSTLYKSINDYENLLKVINSRCRVFLSEIDTYEKVDKYIVINSAEQIGRGFNEVDRLVESNFKKHGVVFDKVLTMIKLLLMEPTDIKEGFEDSWIDLGLKELAQKHDKFYDFNIDNFDKLKGENVVIGKSVLKMFRSKIKKR